MARDPLFDSVKFFAIFLVVFWHVVGAMCSPEAYASLHVVDNFRVSVDMPIFFAISGYFVASTITSVNTGKFIKHIRSYFWPFVVVSILFAILASLLKLTSVSGILHFSAVGLSFYHANDVMYSFLTNRWSFLSFLARQIVGCVAIVGVLYMFSKITKISWLAPKLATLGTTTLGVYILHHWILERMVTCDPNRVTGVMALFVALILFTSCHLVTKLTMKCPWSRITMWGRFD